MPFNNITDIPLALGQITHLLKYELGPFTTCNTFLHHVPSP